MSNIVLLSGGSGRRLWPLSSSAKPKQFLEYLPKENGDRQSMLQRMWGKLGQKLLTDRTLIVANGDQQAQIYEQLGDDVNVVVEPSQRDTFAAIALSVAWLFRNGKCDVSEKVTVVPVDLWIEDDFIDVLLSMEDALNEFNEKIAIIGIQPTEVSDRYGYIDFIDLGTDAVGYVDKFIEKPNIDTARNLIERGALWNAGVFCFEINFLKCFIEDILKIDFSYESILASFGDLPKKSFDYVVMEQIEKCLCIKYHGAWKDIGVWDTFTGVFGANSYGRVFLSESNNTHVINDMDIPVIVQGVNDVVIVITKNGILVSDKKSSGNVKNILNGVTEI